MRRIALFLFPLLVLACSKEKERASTRLVIKYTQGFEKGCFSVEAKDEVNESLVETKGVMPKPTQIEDGVPYLTAVVVQKDGWSKKFKVRVTAHEIPCSIVDDKVTGEGKQAVTVERSFEFPSEGIKDETASAIILETDDGDRDGYIAESKGGSDCYDSDENSHPGATEVCDAKDNDCNGAVDEGLDKDWYLDGDGDGIPRGPNFERACAPPSSKHIVYSENGPFDCRDDPLDFLANKVFPGNRERCDGIDNNCDDVVDEGFDARGVTCNTPQCGGVTVCSDDGEAVVCNQPPGRLYYPDRDGDGQGAVGSTAILKCGTDPADLGTVPNADDCDDADPAARVGLAEVCDAIDNNCDGIIDNTTPTCGTMKQVASYHLTSSNQDWKTVAVGSNGHVWVAGRGGKLALRRPGEQKFESFSFGDLPTTVPPDQSLPANDNNCGNHTWTHSWVDSNGRVFLGGEEGWLALHTGAVGTANFTCQPGTLHSQNISGMVGFEEGNETTLYFGDTGGRLYRWQIGGTPAYVLLNDSAYSYNGLHAFRPNFVLAVGGESGRQSFFSYEVNPATSTASPVQQPSTPDNVNGLVRAVWMGTENKACAVGDNASVWRWDRQTNWKKENAPMGVAGTLTSVVMRNDAQSVLAEQCYVVGGNSMDKVHRLTPYGWAKAINLPAATATEPLNDIAITSTGELWIVGEEGRVFHYPEL